MEFFFFFFVVFALCHQKKIEHSLNITVTLFLCTKAAKKEFDSVTDFSDSRGVLKIPTVLDRLWRIRRFHPDVIRLLATGGTENQTPKLKSPVNF